MTFFHYLLFYYLYLSQSQPDLPMKLKIFIFSVLLFQLFQANGQIYREMPKVNMDSLLLQLTSADGTEKIDILNRLSVALLIDDTDSSLRSANLAIALSEKLDYQKGKADGFFNLGNCYYILDEFQPTTNYYLKALRTYEDLDPSVEEGIVNLQLGDLNSFSGRYKEALSYYHRAASNYQKLNHKT